MEVHHYCKAWMLEASYKEDIKRLENHMWAVGTMKEASVHRLKHANAWARIEVGVAELKQQCEQQEWQVMPSINNLYSNQPATVVAHRCAL